MFTKPDLTKFTIQTEGCQRCSGRPLAATSGLNIFLRANKFYVVGRELWTLQLQTTGIRLEEHSEL